jgi:cytochrome c-type biogenesis protein CcmF
VHKDFFAGICQRRIMQSITFVAMVYLMWWCLKFAYAYHGVDSILGENFVSSLEFQILVDMGELGKVLLAAVFLLCGFATAFGLAARMLARHTSGGLNPERAGKVLFWARRTFVLAAGLSVASLILFTAAFLTDNFSIAAVAQYSSTKLPFFYKLSAVWAGASGSLLLWSVAVFLLLALWQFKIQNLGENISFNAIALSIGAGVCLAFSALLVFVARPFAGAEVPINEGMGLNPLLQNFWMVIHPPLLFVGYSAFLIPFVIALSCVFAGRTEDAEVYRMLRRWLLFGVCFLSVGIATGARWSYVELGWGGYWAWDPVENASLLPWLVAVAALHSVVGIWVADKFRLWAVILAPVPFILCLVATFVARSGFLSSVHSFDRSAMSSVLLAFIGCCVLLWLVCVIRAVKNISITPCSPSPFHLDKSEILSWAVVTFVFAAVIIGVATFWPVIWKVVSPFLERSSGFMPTSVFYNAVISAAGITWAFLVGVAALSDLPRIRPWFTLKVLVCCATGLVCFGSVFRLGEKQFLIRSVCGICAFSVIGIFLRLLHRLKKRDPRSFLRSKSGGGEIAHLGLLLLVVAAGFSWGEQSAQTLLTRGGKITLSGYEFVYDSFEHKLSDGVTKAGPEIVVRKKGLQIKLWPHSNLYPTSQSTSEVAVHTRLAEDIYVSFDGVDRDGGVIITAKIKPFMFWLWFAALLIVTGVVLAMLEGRRNRAGIN